MLYFYPPSPISSGGAYVSMIENVITTQNTSYITFQVIDFYFPLIPTYFFLRIYK